MQDPVTQGPNSQSKQKQLSDLSLENIKPCSPPEVDAYNAMFFLPVFTLQKGSADRTHFTLLTNFMESVERLVASAYAGPSLKLGQKFIFLNTNMKDGHIALKSVLLVTN